MNKYDESPENIESASLSEIIRFSGMLCVISVIILALSLAAPLAQAWFHGGWNDVLYLLEAPDNKMRLLDASTDLLLQGAAIFSTILLMAIILRLTFLVLDLCQQFFQNKD